MEGVGGKTETGDWKTGTLGGDMKGSGALAVLAKPHFFTEFTPTAPVLIFEPDCRVRSRYSQISHHGHRARDRLASARADPGGGVLQREDICTVGGTALGLAQERATESLMLCSYGAVNCSMSRGGFGGLVASGRVLCNGVPGGMGWDGMGRGPGAHKMAADPSPAAARGFKIRSCP